jgi:hypothetical protein
MRLLSVACLRPFISVGFHEAALFDLIAAVVFAFHYVSGCLTVIAAASKHSRSPRFKQKRLRHGTSPWT